MPSSRLRFLLAILALVVITGAFFVLPYALANGLLWGGVLLSLSYGAWQLRLQRWALPPWRDIRLPMRTITRLSGAIGVAFVLVSSYALLPANTISLAEQGIVLWLIAVLCWALPFRRVALAISPTKPPLTTPAPSVSVRGYALALGLIGILASVQWNYQLVDFPESPISHHVALWGLLASWGILVWSLAGVAWQGRGWLRGRRWSSHTVLLFVIMLIGLYVRVYHLETGIHRWIDEINFLDGINLLKTSNSRIILSQFGGITAFSWLFPYTQWLTYSVMGPSLISLRLPAVLFGVAQIPALYLLVSTLFDKRTALISALFLATFPPSLHFSRMGLNNIADPFFGILALACIARFIRHGNRYDAVLAGLCLGLTHYFYEGGRLFYGLFIACWLTWMVLVRMRYRTATRHGRTSAIFGFGVFLAVILPMYAVWTFYNLPIFPRFGSVGRGAEDIGAAMTQAPSLVEFVWQQVRFPLLSYVHVPDFGAFYHNDTGFILPVFVPFFLLGLAYCVWRIRTLGGSLLFWWCLATAVANAFVNNGVDAPRYNVVFPALCAVLGVGVSLVWQWVLAKRPLAPQRPYLRGVLLSLLLLMGAGGATHYYLGYLMPEYYFRQFYYEFDFYRKPALRDTEDAVFRAVDLQPPIYIHIYPITVSNAFLFGASLTYFDLTEENGYQFRWDYARNLNDDLFRTLPTNVPHAFFIDPSDGATLELIKKYFNVSAPQYSRYDIPKERQMVLIIGTSQKPFGTNSQNIK